jgi:hypothetical protein
VFRAHHSRLFVTLLGLSLSLLLPHCAFATNKKDLNCHPPIDQSATQYVIGYGSLMNNKSRFFTLKKTIPAYPIKIQGYERGWFGDGYTAGFSTTYLGVIKKTGAHLNAVYFELPMNHFKEIDKREQTYCRSLLSPQQFTLLSKTSYKKKSQFWIYHSHPSLKKLPIPTKELPIVQSYVDIFLTGCLNIGKQFQLLNFSKNCIRTTRYWSTHWVNDRIYPRRPFIYQKNAFEIDHLIKDNLPKKFKAIQIE